MTQRIGIAGCGFIATIHSFVLGALAKAGIVDARIVAVHDIDHARATEMAARHDALVCDDVDALVEAVDVLWVCTWTAEHLAVVRAAAEAGRAVFCEKPLGPTLRESEAVAALLERVPHQVGLVLRHAPVFAALVDEVRSGAHGAPLAVVMRDDQFFPIQGHYASSWRADVAKAGGGTLLEHSIHDVDVLRWILGDPATVRATANTHFGHEGIDDVASVTFAYDGGAIATLVSVWHQVLSRPSLRRLEVFCERALLWTDDDYLGPLHVETPEGARAVELQPPAWAHKLGVPAEHLGGVAIYADQARSFLTALAEPGGRPSPDAATAMRAHVLVDAAYRSAAAGGEVAHIGA